MSLQLNVLQLMLPPAQMHHRLLSVVLDLVLVFFLSLLIIGKFWIPMHCSDGVIQFRILLDSYMPRLSSGEFSEFLKRVNENTAVVDMFVSVDRLLFLITWLYFSLSAWCLKGGTLGKQIFNLRVLKITTFKAPRLMDCVLRSGIFAFFLFTAWPFFMCFNLFFMCIHKMHRGVHDWFCQTYVVNYDVLEQIRGKIEEQLNKNLIARQ